MVFILQWNARSLIANGQDFKQFVLEREERPDVVCIQETWLKSGLDFILYGYVAVRKDIRKGRGGGCATFIKQGIPYRIIDDRNKQECITVKGWARNKEIIIIHYYNPCQRLELKELEEIGSQNNGNIVWCGDFNGHNTLLGSERTDSNGQIYRRDIDEMNLICLNDGRGTRIDLKTGKESILDLSLVSSSIANQKTT